MNARCSPPHGKVEGWKDFFVHLFTITIGLLIALGLEGCVEWQHHRHLATESKDALRGEIAQNLKTLNSFRQPIKDQQKQLDEDLALLAAWRNRKIGEGHTLSIGFQAHSFDNVAWRTVQATGALTYMSYP